MPTPPIQSETTATQARYAAVAVPVPLRQVFDFIIPAHVALDDEALVGRRVLVPFGPRKLVGIITQCNDSTNVSAGRLKPIIELLDDEAIFDATLWQTLAWVSRYYIAPIGEVFEMALPTLLRKANGPAPSTTKHWILTEEGRVKPIEELDRAPVQLAIIKKLIRSLALSADDFAEMNSGWRSAIKALTEKGWVQEENVEPRLTTNDQAQLVKQSGFELNQQQQAAATHLVSRVQAKTFSVSLLLGVTGSGKTEVYFAAIQASLEANTQALVLVPEIGLTPQLLERFQARFSVPIAVMHSNLSDKERHLAWWHTKTGEARIIIGTRSAVLSSIPELGLIVVDEEHDTSFKQQDGVRYHARDTAIYRAKLAQVPIVLGSATPALESYYNALHGRYSDRPDGHPCGSPVFPLPPCVAATATQEGRRR